MNLTSAEREDAGKGLEHMTPNDRAFEVMLVDRAVEEFALRHNTDWGPLLPTWLARILSVVTDGYFTEDPARRFKHEVVAAFHEQMGKSLSDASKGSTEIGDHPWGDGNVACGLKWTRASDYQIWKVYNACQMKMTEISRRLLLDYVSGVTGEVPDWVQEELEATFKKAIMAYLEK